MDEGGSTSAGDRALLVEREIEAIVTFRDQNPNPELRMTVDGRKQSGA